MGEFTLGTVARTGSLSPLTPRSPIRQRWTPSYGGSLGREASQRKVYSLTPAVAQAMQRPGIVRAEVVHLLTDSTDRAQSPGLGPRGQRGRVPDLRYPTVGIGTLYAPDPPNARRSQSTPHAVSAFNKVDM
ncbi:hypothetical protein NDU88_004083 [Pleurodeles waltl]|uniref:Uncharacterized protein n=1 Tax=Pleurodeles waltl TaxID=8319 RepID=A0AAV7MWH3_PLEWA|nr:hypothetical protein NDU88_004083 [Pleurodeles waltl]